LSEPPTNPPTGHRAGRAPQVSRSASGEIRRTDRHSPCPIGCMLATTATEAWRRYRGELGRRWPKSSGAYPSIALGQPALRPLHSKAMGWRMTGGPSRINTPCVPRLEMGVFSASRGLLFSSFFFPADGCGALMECAPHRQSGGAACRVTSQRHSRAHHQRPHYLESDLDHDPYRALDAR